MKHRALQLYDYHVWANNKWFERLKELPAGIYDQEIESVFPSIAETIVHMYMVDVGWLGVMKEDSFEKIQAASAQAAEAAKGRNLGDMQVLFAELSRKYKAFFQETDLDKPMAPEHPNFGKLETTLSELIQHVVNHGTYHRGNIAAMIREQGYPGVMTDYMMYLYEVTR